MILRKGRSRLLASALVGVLAATVSATDVIRTDGFSNCGGDGSIKVQKMDISYNKGSNQVYFNVAGESTKEQKVMASLVITAYGKEVFTKDFNPCNENITQLCPLPTGNFSAAGNQTVPDDVVAKIPSIAFSIPNLDGVAKMELTSLDDNSTIACIDSTVNNGKTVAVPAVTYAAAGVAAAALALSGLSALGAAGQPGAPSPSPSFGEIIVWFQGMAINGMHSVPYPSVYRSFSQNFAFSGLLIQWGGMQKTIDSFRAKTGGNTTDANYEFLKHNTTIVYEDPSTNLTKRAILDTIHLFTRDSISTNGVNATNGTTAANSQSQSKSMVLAHGIQAYVEQLTIPQANTFMTVLLIFSIVIASMIVAILLFKVILETWALFGSFPKRLTGFRKHYWWTMAKGIANLIFLLYGVWTIYCIFQFTNGDSWVAKLLAGLTFALFTAVLLFFTVKIWLGHRKFKKLEGDHSGMYDDKEFWRKWSIFYGNYKKSYWWLFVPAIIYMFAKGCVLAGANGHGLVQTAGQLIIESIMLVLLLWTRPFSLKSGNWINIIIQVVRVLSVVCILIFVEELGISQSTKTVTGVVLIVVQSALTGVLTLLLIVNSIIVCCKENPHRRRRKEAARANKDDDTLTPLDAHNSMLLNSRDRKGFGDSPPPLQKRGSFVSGNPLGFGGRLGYSPIPNPQDQRYLLNDAGDMGTYSPNHSRQHSRTRSISPVDYGREPTLPNFDTTSVRRYQ